jgi:hypothetical protein
VLLTAVGLIGFTQFVIPMPPTNPLDVAFLLVPASLYGALIAYAWLNTREATRGSRMSEVRRIAESGVPLRAFLTQGGGIAVRPWARGP